MKLEKKLARTGGARQRALGRVGTAAERATLRAAAAAHASGSIASLRGGILRPLILQARGGRSAHRWSAAAPLGRRELSS